MTTARAKAALDGRTGKFRVGSYNRKSKMMQGRSKSVEDQIRLYGRDLVAHPTWVDVDTYVDDGISASAMARKVRIDWPRLKADIEAGRFDLIWVWEISRFSREEDDWNEFSRLVRTYGLLIYVHEEDRVYDPGNDATDQADLLRKASESVTEVAKIQVRVRRAAAPAMMNGDPWGTLRYGYARTYDPITRRPVEQVEHEAKHARNGGHARGPIVREVARRYAAGESSTHIALDMTRRGIETPADAQHNDRTGDARRSEWEDTTVRKMATSAVYTGVRVYQGKQAELKGKVIPGRWPALIDMSTFDACLARKARASEDMAARRPGAPKLKWLLTGIAKCAKCGRRAKIKKFATGPRYECPQGCVLVLVDDLDSYVVARLLAWLAIPATWHALRNDAAGHVAAERELALATAEVEWWSEPVNTAGMTREQIAKQIAAGNAAVEAARTRVSDTALPPSMRYLVGPKAAARKYTEADLGAKRAMIDELLSITIKPAGRGVREFEPVQRVTIVWKLTGEDITT